MICLLGGTFDPVHFGHLRPALEVRQALGISRVHLLPCHRPPHRDPPRLDAGQRLTLLQLAVDDEPGLAIDTRELQRPGPSYMIDTLAELRAEQGDTPLCLALGVDALAGLDRWHRWRELTDLCHLVVMQRPGAAWPQQGELAQRLDAARVTGVAPLRERPAGCVLGIGVTQLDIAATHIRQLLARGESPRYLLPDAVLDYIRQENWYAD